MSRVKLNFKCVTEIVGTDDVGLLILVDEEEKRQLAIPCDQNMLYQFGLRVHKEPITHLLFPEVMWTVISTQTDLEFEIVIHDLIDGQYRAILNNKATLDPVPIRISDALLLAYISDVPVYIEEKLMKRQSVEYQQNTPGMAVPVNTITDDMLKRALEKAIEDENYELASHLRDEMKLRNLLDS